MKGIPALVLSALIAGCAAQPHATQPGVLPLTEEGVRQALTAVYDPELDMNIIELGLVRAVAVAENKDVHITVIFTSPFCPYAGILIAEIKQAVSSIEHAGKVRVVVDDAQVWTPELMSEDARRKLEGLFR